jgi:hypothetical protein
MKGVKFTEHVGNIQQRKNVYCEKQSFSETIRERSCPESSHNFLTFSSTIHF